MTDQKHRISFSLSTTLVTVSLLVFACDTLQIGDSVTVTETISDLALHVGEEPSTIQLSNYFSVPNTHPLLYRVRTKGEAARASLRNGILTVSPVLSGTSEITVSASQLDAPWRDIVFSVRVVCAWELLPDETSYFPHEVGQEWIYDYLWDRKDMFEPYHVRETGVRVWKVINESGDCSEKIVTIEETYEGRTDIGIAPFYDSTRYDNWTRTIQARLSSSLYIENYMTSSLGFESTPWRFDNAMPDIAHFEVDIYCAGWCGTREIDMKKNTGIIKWSQEETPLWGSSKTKLTLR